ncbi:hypothetical protein BHE74_00007717 [Ensete ventricosum]|uniref:Uncharacterized protein n=1 Tax=Ensete ventricosum TaxID=4639 RepID=A0A445MCF4_ENSVE|nr:hypothetical protein BHE74_00007717 [Ensete ventricosum]RZR71935.1 hypothetical protein BHM03_00008843 [Ensete ventricosum]
MKNPWNNMFLILLLPLQEFMSLTSLQGNLRTSAPCSIFYIDSLHALGHFTKFHPGCFAP